VAVEATAQVTDECFDLRQLGHGPSLPDASRVRPSDDTVTDPDKPCDHAPMAEVTSLPASGDVYFDSRGEGRTLRVSWHHADGLVILSLWHHNVCVGSFRLAAGDVRALIDALVAGLGDGYVPLIAPRAAS
jgi:hypothetical protein